MADPLFILGSGRSGTTLLQRVLNTYDDITIWGEHSGFLLDTASAYFRLVEARGSRVFLFPNVPPPITCKQELAACTDPEHWQAWLNFFSEADAREFFRTHVESFFRHSLTTDDQIWGFKEIRYGSDRVIEFLSTLYPNAIFVFICREGISTVASQGKAFEAAGRFAQHVPTHGFRAACRRWRQQNASLRAWHSSGKLRSYWIHFEDLTQGGDTLEPLLAALGKELGPDQRKVFTLDEGHGSAYGDTVPQGDQVRRRWATLGFLPLLAAELLLGDVNSALGYSAPRRVAWVRALRNLVRPATDSMSARTAPRAASGADMHADRSLSEATETRAGAPV